MIQVKNLTFTYPGADIPTLRDVNLMVEKGDLILKDFIAKLKEMEKS